MTTADRDLGFAPWRSSASVQPNPRLARQITMASEQSDVPLVLDIRPATYSLEKILKLVNLDMPPSYNYQLGIPALEGILIGIAPQVLLQEEKTGKYRVRAGTDLLIAGAKFIAGDFPLRDNPLLGEAAGKYFNQLRPRYLNRLDDTQIIVTVLKYRSDERAAQAFVTQFASVMLATMR